MSKKVQDLTNKLQEKNFTKWGLDLNITVSLLSGLILIVFSIIALTNLEGAHTALESFKNLMLDKFSFVFIWATNIFIVVVIFLIFSKVGKIKIGGDDCKPEFSRFAWYAMLMSAGMGIGLMFWSVGEPLFHESSSPIFDSGNNTHKALATTFFHWGIHPWAIYAIISLALAFFAFNKRLPLSPRSFFYPIFKDKIFGVFGDIIDTLSVLAALVGLATSLGFGVQQINSGLSHLFGIGQSTTIQVILIAIITGIATISVVSGIGKGVRILSELNIRIAGIFMIAILLIGPTMLIFKDMFFSTIVYLKDFIPASIFVDKIDKDWANNWTIFYWAWWISWSPFVGMFIAKISKGRTVREFLVATLVIPTVLSIVWLSVFGSTAIFVNGNTDGMLLEVVSNNLPVALFEMIEFLVDWKVFEIVKVLLQLTGVFLVISFFVTSSDSGSLVVDSLASGGKVHSPVTQRVFWAVTEGLVAAVLLLIGGSEALSILQTAVITTGLPFAIIILIVSFVLIKELYDYLED